jgi:glutamine synthetase
MRAKRYRELTPWGHSYINYDLVRSGDYQGFVADLATRLDGLKIGLASFVTEYGYGMYEAALPPKSPLEAADDAMRFKLHLRELCAERGMVATFMTRFQPPKKESACGAHHHLSLWRDGKNIFAAGANQLTDIGQKFLAGLLARLPDSHLLFRPTVNSYRRLDRQAWSPEDVSWGYENRMAAIRAITTPNPEATRFEHRVPGADINPYFTVAAMLAAGLDGIEQSLPLPAISPGSPEAQKLTPLSRTLMGSVDTFRASAFIETLLGPELKNHYIASRVNEQVAFETWLAQHITDFEWQRYFIGT